VQVSDELNIDLAADGRIYGIELLNANAQLARGRGLVLQKRHNGAESNAEPGDLARQPKNLDSLSISPNDTRDAASGKRVCFFPAAGTGRFYRTFEIVLGVKNPWMMFAAAVKEVECT
jgi:hypothetical protein